MTAQRDQERYSTIIILFIIFLFVIAVSGCSTTYYECAVKLDAWIKWYDIQKQIYQDIK